VAEETLSETPTSLQSLLCLENTSTFLALAGAFHFDQLDRIASHIEQFPNHRLVEKAVQEESNMPFVLG
jgi:hypothetical protein